MAAMGTHYDSTRTAWVPDPYRPEVSAGGRLTPAERHRLIAETAYLIAERRGFAPGHELSDWLAAEHEVDRQFGPIQA